jgi:hypothetical protein
MAQGTAVYGTTLRHIAAYSDAVEIGKRLLDRAMNPDLRSADGGQITRHLLNRVCCARASTWFARSRPPLVATQPWHHTVISVHS